jgi:acetylornithine/N-succinyldiaminopimelate aminotransferase
VACSAGLVVMQTLLGGALKNCLKMGEYLVEGLEALQNRFSFIREVRGKGLMIGMELEIEGSKVADSCMQEGLLLNCTAYKVLRFVPPLTIKKSEIDRGLDILEKVLARQ